MFGCKEISQYLIACEGDAPSMEEVISIYCLHKYSRGHCSGRILGKIRQLCAHLRMIGREDILESGREALRIIALEVSLGGARIGSLPAMTPIGKLAVNDLRRLLVRRRFLPSRKPVKTDAIWGGPLSVESITKEKQRQVCRLRHFDRHVFGENWVEGERPEWAEVYFIRRPALGSGGNAQPLGFVAEDLPLYMTLSRLEASLNPDTPEYAYEARVSAPAVVPELTEETMAEVPSMREMVIS